MTPDIDLDALTALIKAADLPSPIEMEYRFSAELMCDVGNMIVGNGVEARIHTVQTALLIEAALNNLPALLSALTATRAELDERRQYEARIWQRIQAWGDDPTTRLEAFAITWERVEAAERERDATRAELDEACAEIERLKVERGEALLWSPWNDHEVLFEQWAKRRAGAGDGDWLDPSTPAPEEARVLHVGDGEQDTATTHAPRCPACGEAFTPERPGSGERCRGCRYLNRPASVQGAADGEAQA